MKDIEKTLAIVLLAGLAPLGALGHRLPPRVSPAPVSLCGCGCGAGETKGERTPPCAPPRYQGSCRSALCHKRPALGTPKTPKSRPAETNGRETARR